MVVYKVVMPFKDPEAKVAYDKKYRIEKRVQRLIYKHKYYEENCDKIKAYARNSIKNPVKEALRKQHWHKANPESGLKSKKRELTKLGKLFNINCRMMRRALQAWSLTVRKRDNNKCTWCNSTKTLVSHHIWHKAFCPESALDVDNGITLCHDCHMEQHRLDRL